MPVRADVHGWHPLAASVLVGHGRSEHGELAPLPAGDVFDVVLRSFLAAPEARLVRPFLSIVAAVSRVPAWTLHHGCTATSRVVVATRLLDAVEAQVPAAGEPGRWAEARGR